MLLNTTNNPQTVSLLKNASSTLIASCSLLFLASFMALSHHPKYYFPCASTQTHISACFCCVQTQHLSEYLHPSLVFALPPILPIRQPLHAGSPGRMCEFQFHLLLNPPWVAEGGKRKVACLNQWPSRFWFTQLNGPPSPPALSLRLLCKWKTTQVGSRRYSQRHSACHT